MNQLRELIGRIEGIDSTWVGMAWERQNCLTKPPGSLGLLEDIACRVAGIQKTLTPCVDRKRMVVFAADHGVTEEGVSPYPAEVTAQMVANFLRGGAAINAFARIAHAEVVVVDIGVKSPIPKVEDSQASVRFIQNPIRPGTRNFAQELALTEQETLDAILLGSKLACEAKEDEISLIGLGEMGIGNTTTAAAISAGLTGRSSAVVTGRGTGADDSIFALKQSIVDGAVRRHAARDAFSLLRAFGGLEIAGLVGLCLGAAVARIPIVIDGFITASAAALAVGMCPRAKEYMFAGHLSTEPGHRALLEFLEIRPILNLGMRLGEGTGAALAMNVIEAAVRGFVEMATFESAGVSDKQEVAKGVSR
jgi:nicotinate-nucleotide--dimethylbenzimidazole phosphoribosyltransferase